jgi:hypothetical protein
MGAVVVHPTIAPTGAVVLVDPRGSKPHLGVGGSRPSASLRRLLDVGKIVVIASVHQTGDGFTGPVKATINPDRAMFTFGYNRSIFAERTHDVLTAVAFARWLRASSRTERASSRNDGSVDLLGVGEAGPWCAAARVVAGDAVGLAAIDLNRFSFSSIKKFDDPNMLPGGLKYGDLVGMLFASAPRRTLLTGYVQAVHGDLGSLEKAYALAERREHLERINAVGDDFVSAAVNWIAGDR